MTSHIFKVPQEFQPSQDHWYPPHSDIPMIEEQFHGFVQSNLVQSDRYYLPIYWTNYYVQNGYRSTEALDAFVHSLPKDRKYYTVVQYDDGILNEFPFRDVVSFASGGVGTIPIPLLCKEHTRPAPVEKDILASFVGALNGRGRVRAKMFQALSDKPEYVMEESSTTERFIELMNRSEFALCPRGYGKTSYRLYEAMQFDCIPVYVFDSPWVPWMDKINWSDICVMVQESQIDRIPEILGSMTSERKEQMRQNIRRLYKDYFTFEGTFQNIKKWLENEQ